MFTFWHQKILLICPRIIAPIRYVYLIGVKNILIFLLVVFAYFAGRRRRRERRSRSRSRITCMRMFILNVVCLFVRLFVKREILKTEKPEMNHWGKEENYKTQLTQKAGSTIWTGQATCGSLGFHKMLINIKILFSLLFNVFPCFFFCQVFWRQN